MPLAVSALLGTLAENWWLLLLRGLAAIAFGVIAFFWPGITLVALTYLWGAYLSNFAFVKPAYKVVAWFLRKISKRLVDPHVAAAADNPASQCHGARFDRRPSLRLWLHRAGGSQRADFGL
jgi:hypothetical protein